MQAWRVKLIAADGNDISWQQVVTRIAVAIPALGLAGLGLLGATSMPTNDPGMIGHRGLSWFGRKTANLNFRSLSLTIE